MASMVSLEVTLETHARTQITHALSACYNDCHCIPVAGTSGVGLLRFDLLQLLLDILISVSTEVLFNSTHFSIKNHGKGLVICDAMHHAATSNKFCASID